MKRLVIGCGYIGGEVASRWVEQGNIVHATTRSPERAVELEAVGLVPIVADITDPDSIGELPVVDTVLFAVGMDRSRYDSIRDVYVGGLANVLERLPEKTGHVIYVSSTGVYGQSSGEWVDENSPAEPIREGGRACLEAEQLLRASQFAERTTILRLAGIYGPRRLPSLERLRSSERSRLNPIGYINLIHRDDAVQVIVRTAQMEIKNEVILVSDGNSPQRREYYEMLAVESGLEPVVLDGSGAHTTGHGSRSSGLGKRIRNDKMKAVLNFKPRWIDLRAGIRNSLGGQ